MHDFRLHPRLAQDCAFVGELGLSRLLLFGDARYPWSILVPRRPDLREPFDLDAAARSVLFAEACTVGEMLLREFGGDKLNIGALGNQVEQLHVHVVARRRDDPAWPGPVWGHSPPVGYTPAARDARLATIRSALAGWLVDR
jgi:diadenosine tetraphosphate (Ap4A) HIT family hydrolase